KGCIMKILSKDIIFEVIFLAMIIGFPLSATDSPAKDDFNLRLAKAYQPWKEKKPSCPTFEEFEETLKYWQEKYPQYVSVEVPNKTSDGRPIYVLKITDKSVPDEDKQVVLLNAAATGGYRNVSNAMLHLSQWLLSNDAFAKETRQKQIVLLMPIPAPATYEKPGKYCRLYDSGRGRWWDLETLTLKEPEKHPEIKAYVKVVDKYKPEVHADFHGQNEEINGLIMNENVGTATSNFTLRPWDWRVQEAMMKAGNDTGFGYERNEACAQRMFWGPNLQPIAEKLWWGRPYFYTAHYAYCKYHTMIMAGEVGWPDSYVARIKGLLRIGNNIWEGEPVRGYPVTAIRYIKAHRLMAWGKTAEQRRKSRVELWQRQAGFTVAMLYPDFDGRATFIVATTKKGAEVLDPNCTEEGVIIDILNTKPNQLSERLRGLEGFNAEAIDAFMNAGPETKIYKTFLDMDKPAKLYSVGDNRPIENGLALRLRIPYPNPELCDLRLNGNLLEESDTDGYQRWYADGFTQVQVNVPPEKSKDCDLYIVTCAYKPQKLRTYGWKVPDEVTKRLKQKKMTEQK
ncbi:MAG: hypothetical protein JXB29_06920, partial [Sedimentisphaerales bacterium]|nr:hypothetical protein [Sedimentisphaerales bacterium]